MRYLLFIILFIFSTILAVPPSFGPQTTIEANGSAIQVTTGMASPCVYDWDGDGKKDLILGQYGAGKLRLYLNVGANNAPEFADFSYMQANGSDISLTAD